MISPRFVVRGALEGAPLELRGASRPPSAVLVQRSLPENHVPTTVESLPSQADISHELALQEARAAGYEAGHAQGQKDGYQAGLQQARERAEEEYQLTLQENRASRQKLIESFEKLNSMVAAIAEQKHYLLDNAGEDMVALAFEALCRMLGEAPAMKEIARLGVLHALAGWRGKAALEVHVHPDDLSWLKEDAGLSAQIALERNHLVQWIANTDVVIGGCILRSTEGALDARFEVQLDALKNTLLKVRAAHHAEPRT